MLFNSYVFLFIFLPISLLGFYLIGARDHHRTASAWLVACSLFFYGWWNHVYITILLTSILLNYSIGSLLAKTKSKKLLLFGIALNLSALGYFKYANFFIENINLLLSTPIQFYEVVLPLAISFFTFQQIAYLTDAYRKETREYNFLHYCLFVTFFPQLIAGPIVHHKEMMPQFGQKRVYSLISENIGIGLAILLIGLFKKVVLADGVSVYASPMFAAAEAGTHLTFCEAWFGAIAYSLQLYFDFSGYADMAIGAAKMFNISLPINFFSPYKATSIIEFWRRWHITLSRFLKDYIYIPLGGSRNGRLAALFNLSVTMLLGGIWHGAGWTFAVWGALHGIYLIINHLWRDFCKAVPALDRLASLHPARIFFHALTLGAVIFAWVFFRAETIQGALNIVRSMSSFQEAGVGLLAVKEGFIELQKNWDSMAFVMATLGGPLPSAGQIGSFGSTWGVIWLLSLSIVALAVPNTAQLYQLEDKYRAMYFQRHQLLHTNFFAFALGLLSILSLVYLDREAEFLYFQF